MKPNNGKGEFLSSLRTERTNPFSEDRTLLWQLVYYSALLDLVITVPAGFVTNFASVPRAPVTYWLFGGIADEAAVIHDFGYGQGLMPKSTADSVYLEALEACGVPLWKRTAMYLAVKTFGERYYQRGQAS